MLRSLVVTAVLGLAATSTFAQTTSTPRIDNRQDRQEQRIDNGVASGQLNQREAARLDRGQERVQKMENRAAADGKMTRGERVVIEKAQDNQSRRIARQRHDRQ